MDIICASVNKAQWGHRTDTDYGNRWGHRTDTDYGNRWVTFPIAFPKKCFIGLVNTIRDGDGSNGTNFVSGLSNTGMNTVCDRGGGYWIAIGL